MSKLICPVDSCLSAAASACVEQWTRRDDPERKEGRNGCGKEETSMAAAAAAAVLERGESGRRN